MGNEVGTRLSLRITGFKHLLATALVINNGLEQCAPLIELPAFDVCHELCEGQLCTVIALCALHTQAPDNRLDHRDSFNLVVFSDLDWPIGLFQDQIGQSVFSIWVA